jgi:hypothetical protein
MSTESLTAGTIADAIEEFGEEESAHKKPQTLEATEEQHDEEGDDILPEGLGSEITQEDVEEICRRFAVWARNKVKHAKANKHNLGYLQHAIRQRLVRLITKELPRVGVEVGARARGRTEPFVVERWRYETALKFYFDSLKGASLTHINATLREQLSVQAVARADALLEALGYDVDLELD